MDTYTQVHQARERALAQLDGLLDIEEETPMLFRLLAECAAASLLAAASSPTGHMERACTGLSRDGSIITPGVKRGRFLEAVTGYTAAHIHEMDKHKRGHAELCERAVNSWRYLEGLAPIIASRPQEN